MIQAPLIDYFENGQALPSLLQWKQFLKEDTDGVLSVCRTERSRLLELEQAASSLARTRERMKEILGDLSADLRAASARVPAVTGFFFSQEESLRAFAAVCYFLERSEGVRERLGECELACSLLSEFLASYALAQHRLEGVLSLTEDAARSLRLLEAEQESRALLEELQQDRERYRTVQAAFLELREQTQAFCLQTLTAFWLRIEDAADLNGKGKECDPKECSRLLGELLSATQRTLALLDREI